MRRRTVIDSEEEVDFLTKHRRDIDDEDNDILEDSENISDDSLNPRPSGTSKELYRDNSITASITGLEIENSALELDEDIKDLFKYTNRYIPKELEIKAFIKAFIPDAIPAFGTVDNFIKIPRPDGVTEYLGLEVLDEPGENQSFSPVVTLKIEKELSISAQELKPVIGSIASGDNKRSSKIDKWIKAVDEGNKSRPLADVVYTHPMPDIENLMLSLPQELENNIKEILHSDLIKMDLKECVKVVCENLGIPIYDNLIESLHVLFTLYIELKTNPFLNGNEEDGFIDKFKKTDILMEDEIKKTSSKDCSISNQTCFI